MSDDLCNDCDCGDCDCDCDFDCCDFDFDCCDCDWSCDDCFPQDSNVIILCCCFPPVSNNNQSNKTNRGNTSPDCFCCCCSPRRQRQRRQKKKKKKIGFCCWRLWCCLGRKEPTPPPSPKHPRPDELSPRSRYRRDGRYPMDDDDMYRDDRWAMRDDELSGGRYPMRGEMGIMYRDEFHGRGGARWDDPRGMRREYRGRDDRREIRGMTSREVQRNNEEYARRLELDLPPKGYHESRRQDKPEIARLELELDLPPKGSHESKQDKPEIAQEGHQFESKWSKPVKYEENATHTKD